MCYYNRIYAKYDHTKTSPFWSLRRSNSASWWLGVSVISPFCTAKLHIFFISRKTFYIFSHLPFKRNRSHNRQFCILYLIKSQISHTAPPYASFIILRVSLRASFQRGKYLSINAWKRALWLGSNRWHNSCTTTCSTHHSGSNSR